MDFIHNSNIFQVRDKIITHNFELSSVLWLKFMKIYIIIWPMYYLTTSKLTSSRFVFRQTAASAPFCTTLTICRSYLNIICTVFFDISNSDDTIHTVNRLSVGNQFFDLDFATMVDLMLDHNFHHLLSHTALFELPVQLLKH